ncbi:MAG: calycin-like domain-containing protein [Prevotella sp.]|nr:calycin-like domain-containing protein [Prevotella sp.]
MKRIFTLIAAVVAVVSSANAQMGHGAMTFVGKSNFYVTMMGQKAGETTQVSDTIKYAGADFTLPSMKYGDMVIPSFQITGTTFSGGYAGVTWDDQTFTATATDAEGNEKTITGTSLKGSFTHGDGIYKVQLEVAFKYGSMPFPITYSIESYYVKEYAGENSVMVGGQFGPYTANVTHKLRTYIEEGVTMMDVEIPPYSLAGTVMGDLTLGTYTVKGLTYDSDRGGYYKDYSADNLSVHFKAVNNGMTTMDADYALQTAGKENILVEITNGKAKITNNFQPGAMPFPINAVMDQSAATAVENIHSVVVPKNNVMYNLRGQRVVNAGRGIVIRNGKKYVVR